jgi:hypothetical protein
MSMEIHVLSDREIASMAAWQQAITAEGFGLQLSAEASFPALKGFLPARSAGKTTGFECYHDDPRELLIGYHDFDFGHPWKHALSFRWGGDIMECLAAYMAAAAYAKATDGVVFVPDDGELLTPPLAIDRARETERELPAIVAQLDRIKAQDK